MKKGYHYTSKKNWEKIQKDGGMKRYLIDKPEMRGYFPEGIRGIWIWPQNPEGREHAGNIIFQLSTKADPEIVKLEVEYNPLQIATWRGRDMSLNHFGHVGKWEYHKKESAIIVESDIPLQNIRVIGEYNTVQRLQ